jgi:hypothetical protein
MSKQKFRDGEWILYLWDPHEELDARPTVVRFLSYQSNGYANVGVPNFEMKGQLSVVRVLVMDLRSAKDAWFVRDLAKNLTPA